MRSALELQVSHRVLQTSQHDPGLQSNHMLIMQRVTDLFVFFHSQELGKKHELFKHGVP